jgi:transcriptional regulator of NAD metabolism
MVTNNHLARTEARLRRYLAKHGRARENYIYHAVCGPHYLVNKEQFSELAYKLAEERVLEVMTGTQGGTTWLVRKDFVDQTIRDGVLF